MKCPKGSMENVHNHSVPPPSAIAQCINEKIYKAVQLLNPMLKPADIACGL